MELQTRGWDVRADAGTHADVCYARKQCGPVLGGVSK